MGQESEGITRLIKKRNVSLLQDGHFSDLCHKSMGKVLRGQAGIVGTLACTFSGLGKCFIQQGDDLEAVPIFSTDNTVSNIIVWPLSLQGRLGNFVFGLKVYMPN